MGRVIYQTVAPVIEPRGSFRILWAGGSESSSKKCYSQREFHQFPPLMANGPWFVNIICRCLIQALSKGPGRISASAIRAHSTHRGQRPNGVLYPRNRTKRSRAGRRGPKL